MKHSFRIALVVAVAFLFMGTLVARAGGRPAESVALLARAQQLEDLRADGGVPFILRAQIRVTSGRRQGVGTYSLTWAATNRWHEEVRLADFSRVRDGVEGGYRQVRAWDYQPQVIFDLDQILDAGAMAQLSPGEDARKVKSRKIDGAVLSCVEIWRKKSRQREVCVNSATGLVVHVGLSSVSRTAVDYIESVALGDRRFPSRMEFQRPDGFSIEVSVVSLERFAGNADSLPVADPAGSEFWGACRDGIPGEATQRVTPIYPVAAKINHEQGAVTLYAHIETDGKVSHLKTLSSASPALAQATLPAVEQWKYKPRTCGGTPVKEETVILVIFKLGG